MKRKLFITMLATIVLGCSTLAYADSIDLRVRLAQAKIDRGIDSGALTRLEAHRLTKELNKVRDDEARMKADGKLNRLQKARLDKELDRLEKHISTLKTNDNTRANHDRKSRD